MSKDKESRWDTFDRAVNASPCIQQGIADMADALSRPPPRHRAVVSPLEYEILVRREIRRALSRGDSRRRVIRDIAAQVTLTRDEVAALVDREMTAIPADVEFTSRVVGARAPRQTRSGRAHRAVRPAMGPIPPWPPLT